MRHRASADFWACYYQHTVEVQKLADGQYKLLKENPRHPSLHFKRVGDDLWSVRVTRSIRAVAIRESDARGRFMFWFWMGSHDEYVRLINE